LAPDGTPTQRPQRAADLAAAVAQRESAESPRWVWAATDTEYARLLRAGVRVERCHDIALTESLLLGRAGRFGEPRSLEAASARLRGLPVPEDPKPAAPHEQGALFGAAAFDLAGESASAHSARRLELLAEVHADQLRRIAAESADSPAVRTLVAAECAGGLVAAEISACGLPWRVEAHDAVLTGLLGPRPFGDALPAKLADLAVRIGAAFGYPPGRAFNADSPAQVLRALRHAGFPVQSTRAWELRGVEHPAAALLLEYKELSRLHAAHGWAWQDAWVRDGRFRPEYVVGGVVSGRWATRNSGALQIPRIMHRAVIADDGWSLVVADAGQLEPRVLAAVSGDVGLARAAGEGDLYAALAAEAFDGDRAAAKLALLGAMYGQTSGGIGPLLTVLHKRFPRAMGYVEEAARTGERGGVVFSQLGRACPPPSNRWRSVVSGLEAEDRQSDPADDTDAGSGAERDGAAGRGRSVQSSGQAARSRGRFTRNFVIQGSAADWALVWLAVLRRKLAELDAPKGRNAGMGGKPAVPFAAAPHLVFFVHDEVVVHTPSPLAEQVAAAVAQAADEARGIVFGRTPVRFPLATAIVDCYADAK
jgi:DNA polymerase-1